MLRETYSIKTKSKKENLVLLAKAYATTLSYL